MRKPDAEAWLDEFNATIKLYRLKTADPSAEGLTLKDAIRKMGTLGITEGDALRYLQGRKRK